MTNQKLTVNLSGTPASRSYDILIGENLLDNAGDAIASRLGQRQCVLISDSNVAPLYQGKVEQSLSGAGHKLLKPLVVPAGEASKNLAQVGSLLEELLAGGVDRKTLIIALGGGVVGDIAGFTASIVLRGIDFVQVPTTLLAQVDSSVGGKTGIDTAYGKNTVGAFYQPRLVLADVSTLDTLPKRELPAGYAEVVKYGLIADRGFFDWCVDHGKEVIQDDKEAQVYAVEYSCAAKAKIVEEDEREAGKRALLNLGHTFGHALETATGFGDTLVHGEAVAIGTLMAFRLAVKMGVCPAKDYEDVHAHFKDVGLPLTPPRMAYDIDQLIALMGTDKKAEGGKITLILPHEIGDAVVHKDVKAETIRPVWNEVLGK
jgi:3-dehydroquinate synthase